MEIFIPEKHASCYLTGGQREFRHPPSTPIMASNGLIHRHWIYVARHMATDLLLFAMAFMAGTVVRFRGHDGWFVSYEHYLPAVLSGALVFACLNYILGLYAPLKREHALGRRLGALAVCIAVSLGIVVAVGYINWSARIGRGVMVYSALALGLASLVHHYRIYRKGRSFRERVVFIVNNRFDEGEARAFGSFGSHLEFVGIVTGAGYQPKATDLPVLGEVSGVGEIVAAHDIDRVVCTATGIDNSQMRRAFCQLRYSGVNVVSLINLCEEVYQFVPLELVRPAWLLTASEAPQMLYIRKVKRAFDILTSLAGLIILGPVMLLGMLAVRITSPGPVFYRQTRLGRFGKPFEVLKLRSMVVDAEKHGAQWSAAGNDPRSTPIGKILRRFRIDEIPQLINVFRGEMSFVGPRPERPEFTEMLSREIPYFQERLLVQPGITGWAQVNYPYGADVADARRKLEYDLYYMKHMSVFLDLFILLDTVSIVFRGGLGDSSKEEHPFSRAIMDHSRQIAGREEEFVPVPDADAGLRQPAASLIS